MRRTYLALAFVAILASCGGDSEDAAPEDAVTVDDAAATTTVAPTTSAPEPTAEETPEPTAEPSGDAVEAWLALWQGAELLVVDPDAARDAILGTATESVFDQIDTIYNPLVDSSAVSTPRTFDNTPTLTANEDGSVQIDDCIFESPRIGNATIWYSGTAEVVDGQWRIVALDLRSEIGCVPAGIAEEAIAGYEAYWDARVEFWQPADPSNPLVEQTMSGIHLDLIRGLLSDHEASGLELRGRAETRPEVVEVRSATEIAVLDCAVQDTERGLYDARGARLADIPPVRDGQTDLNSAVMILEDGVWKVSDVQGQADVSCDAAPTAQGLPVV
ncbi:MAG: hypothetical protein AAF567_11995 [Actinomycetota bacterium]